MKNDYNELLDIEDLTSFQSMILNYLSNGNSQAAAASFFNVSISKIEYELKKLRKLYIQKQHINDFTVPDNYYVKGTSTLIDSEGNVKAQWIKVDKEKEDQLNWLREAVNDIVQEVEGKAEQTKETPYTIDELMAVYTIGDAHIGMYSWAEETGNDFNLEIAEQDLINTMKRLVSSTPNAETALIVDVGDFFHADNQSNETSHSKNKLDVDTRWAKVLKVGLNVMVALVEEALKKHKTVIVRNAIGNHNEHSAIYLALYLDSYFRNEPRVQVEDSPSTFWYKQFGKNLIGVTHGTKLKATALGEIMACDCEEIWSDTKYRYWYTGHIHHDSVKELRTCKVESFRSLIPKDAWHASMGYRSGRDMKSIILHKDYGEIQRSTCSVEMSKTTK